MTNLFARYYSILGRMSGVAVTLLAFLPAASAIERMPMHNMTCAEVHEALQSDGAVILRRPSKHPGMMVYNKYVKNSGHCQNGDYAPLRSIPTTDTKSCKVRQCAQKTHNSHP